MPDKDLCTAMLGGAPSSPLMTDGYKFAMAQAGAPLRSETFYLSFRRPGWYLIPLDLQQVIRRLCPTGPEAAEAAFLEEQGYGLSAAMIEALKGEPVVRAAPRGSWVREREPILTVTGPSFLCSWLEPLAIWLQYPIQVATAAVLEGRREFSCTCEEEARITRLALEATGLAGACRIFVREEDYRRGLRRNIARLRRAVGGEGHRLLEVGMRGATCMAMHTMALQEWARQGLTLTSNVVLARRLGLTPVGTTGHEHQQRWGDDLAGFRAIRDMRPQAPSYLFDTYDAMTRGIPAAVRAIREAPRRRCSVRFDSGDAERQLQRFLAAGVAPTFIFMDGLDDERICWIEAMTQAGAIPSGRRLYGVGGFVVGHAAPTDLTRNRVSAVYKLCRSGARPVMKFSAPGKESLPGEPVIFRRMEGQGPVGLIGQAGEVPPRGYVSQSDGTQALVRPPTGEGVGLSPATQSLVLQLRRRHLGPHHLITRRQGAPESSAPQIYRSAP